MKRKDIIVMQFKELLGKDESIDVQVYCLFMGNLGYLVLTNKRIFFDIRYSEKHSDIYFVSDYHNIGYVEIVDRAIGKNLIINTKNGEYEFKLSDKFGIQLMMDLLKSRKGDTKYSGEQNIKDLSSLIQKNKKKSSVGTIMMIVGAVLVALSLGCWFIGYISGMFR